MRFKSTLLTCLAMAFLGAGTTAFASGFSIFEQGSKASAMGGAFAATADDPTAIFYNVAGIAQQRHMTATAGGTIINFANEFRGDPNDAYTSGATGQYRRHTFVPPNAYLVVPFGKNLTFGIGTFAAFGLRTNWQDPWVGRFVSRDANVKTASVEPALAWQNDSGTIAIGAGAEYRRSHITLNQNLGNLNPFTGRIVDVGNAFLDSDWDSAWGYNVGVLLKPNPNWRFGVAYRGDMTIDYKGTAVFTQIPTGNAQLDAIVKSQFPPNQNIKTSIDYPGTLSVGVATTMLPNWDVEADVTHTTWSRFQSLDIAFATTPARNIHRPQNWKDTMSYRLGGNRHIGENWQVRLGAVYDENPQPTEGVGPLLPDSDRAGVSFGVGYTHGPWILEASDFILHFRERSTDGRSADRFNGTYKTDATLISVNLGYRF